MCSIAGIVLDVLGNEGDFDDWYLVDRWLETDIKIVIRSELGAGSKSHRWNS
jgi:hypothetical protein